jgi:hypothetical protein
MFSIVEAGSRLFVVAFARARRSILLDRARRKFPLPSGYPARKRLVLRPACAGLNRVLDVEKSVKEKIQLSPERQEELLGILKARFEKNGSRHKGFEWSKVQARLETRPAKLWSLNEMEATGGEPDVVGHDAKTGEYIFFDCAPESPKGRTSLCYDREALNSRKEHKPKNCASDLAAAMGVELLTETEYEALQKLGNFDTKSSSWVKTPPEMRKLGGALFGDRRFGRVFFYHNGAESYYSGRGFRASLRA